MKDEIKEFWTRYLDSQDRDLSQAHIEVSIAGNEDNADELLALFLTGKKTAGSGLVKDYKLAGDELPIVGQFWVILDSNGSAKCIVETVRVEVNVFANITEEIARAEGEGDQSVSYWKKAHRDFFTPYLNDWGITDLDQEEVVTEFYNVVFKEQQ